MNINHLIANYSRLHDYMLSAGYSKIYISAVDRTFNYIVKNNTDRWKDYRDVERDLCSFDSKNTNNDYRICLNLIAKFDNREEFPTGSQKNYYFVSKPELNEEFQKFFNYVKTKLPEIDLSESYCRRCSSVLFSFLHYLQENGIKSLTEVKSCDVISYFSNGTQAIKSYDSTLRLKHAMEAGMEWSEDIKRIYIEIPKIHRRRKNIQYLTDEEIAALLKALDDETAKLSLRDRAVGYLLYYTGLRGCDIVDLKINDIDWENEIITIVQKKTAVPVTVPLHPMVGNMIYRYLNEERPKSEKPWIFIRKNAPYRKYSSKTIGTSFCKKIFCAAGIRQNPGDRKGSYIFRHYVVKELLENDVARPVIASYIGHQNPSSIEAYLNTDIRHLKECALSVEAFPIDDEVFQYE